MFSLLLPQLLGVASGKEASWALQNLTQSQLFESEARRQPWDTSFLSPARFGHPCHDQVL